MLSIQTNPYCSKSKTSPLRARLSLIFFIFFLLSFAGKCQSTGYQHYYPYSYSIKRTVARVIDGDTFVLTDSQRVRMLGVDTPELQRSGKPAEPFSDSAYHYTKSLIEGKIIKLTFDEKSFDIFGRLLAYVWLSDMNGKDSLFIQAELLKKGYARISYYNKEKRYYYIFYNLRRTAIRNKLGIWSLTGEE